MWCIYFLYFNILITKFDKVIILQYILDGVILVQQTQTLAPAHNKTTVLHSRDAAVVRFVLHVTFKSFVSEPPDGVGGIPAGHCQPLISDVDSKTRHCASTGLCCSERCSPLSNLPPSAAWSSAANQTHQRQPRLAGDIPLGTTDLHRSVTRMFGRIDPNAFTWLNHRNAPSTKSTEVFRCLKEPNALSEFCCDFDPLTFLTPIDR